MMKHEQSEQLIAHGVKYRDFSLFLQRYNRTNPAITHELCEKIFNANATPEQRKTRMALLKGVKKWEF